MCHCHCSSCTRTSSLPLTSTKMISFRIKLVETKSCALQLSEIGFKRCTILAPTVFLFVALFNVSLTPSGSINYDLAFNLNFSRTDDSCITLTPLVLFRHYLIVLTQVQVRTKVCCSGTLYQEMGKGREREKYLVFRWLGSFPTHD